MPIRRARILDGPAYGDGDGPGEGYHRPRYEGPENRRIEFYIMRSVAAIERVDFRKMSLAYRLDFALVVPGSGKVPRVCGFTEVKRRKYSFRRLPDLWVSVGKAIAARGIMQMTGLPARFIAAYDDGVYAWDFAPDNSAKYRIVWGGRDDRGDWQDKEPMICAPHDEMRLIPGAENGDRYETDELRWGEFQR